MKDDPDQWCVLLKSIIDRYFANYVQFFKIPHEKKVHECFTNEIIRKELLTWLNDVLNENKISAKSVEKSRELRILGNEKFKARDDKTSLKFYTESVIYAPYGSMELSLALGNRSAVLFRLGQFEDCVSDIDLAIKNFNNNTLLPKLVMRKQKALNKLKPFEGAEICLDNVNERVTDTNFSSSEKKCAQTGIIDEFTNNFSNNFAELCTDVDSKIKIKIPLPTVTKGKNEHFPYASCLVELNTNKTLSDRRVVACDDIETGDILFVENPFSFVVLLEYCKSYCQYCCKKLKNPIACTKCTDFLFCNKKCFDSAYSLFHKWECNSFNLLSKVGVGHLALRTLLIASHDQFSAEYERVNFLNTHLDDIATADLIQYVLTANLLLLYLEKFTDFFIKVPVQKSVEELGFILLKHINQVICNGFAITTSGVDKFQLTNPSLLRVTCATGLYSSAAMMNHSCEPNIITSFYENLLIVRANRRIKKGEEIFNCYGVHFRQMNREKRKEILKEQFFFDCNCEHCKLPESEKENEFSLYICQKCGSLFHLKEYQQSKLKCVICSELMETRYYKDLIQKVNNLRKYALEQMNLKNIKEASVLFEKCRNLQLMFMDKNNIDVILGTMDLAECYNILGNFSRSWKYFKKCLPILKNYFGPCSTEYADILMKVLELFVFDVKHLENTVCKIDVMDMLNFHEELLKIIEYNFGSWSEEYVFLKHRKAKLLNFISWN